MTRDRNTATRARRLAPNPPGHARRAVRAFATLAVLAAGALAGGCVSTEALYAEYDAAECPVAPPPTLAGALPLAVDSTESVRELIERSYFPWEPAVYFAFNSDVLDAENVARLEGAVEVLARFEDVHVSLQGFTDRIGSSAYNAWLAERRVGSVRDYLVERGADPERLVSQPLGEGLPVFGDDDARARAVNRRVELMLLDPDGRPLHPLFDFGATADREPFELPLGAARPPSRPQSGTGEHAGSSPDVEAGAKPAVESDAESGAGSAAVRSRSRQGRGGAAQARSGTTTSSGSTLGSSGGAVAFDDDEVRSVS